MLTAYREKGDDWRVEGADLPDNIIWLDLLDPTPEEQKLVETRAKIRVPSKEALSEIEASSRLIIQHGVLYLSTPMVAKGEAESTEISPAGFVLTRNLLVTVRFKQLAPFDNVAERIRTDETLDCSVGVFTAILEAIVDRGADVLEHLAATTDKVSNQFFMPAHLTLNIPHDQRRVCTRYLPTSVSTLIVWPRHATLFWVSDVSPPSSVRSPTNGYQNHSASGCMPSPRTWRV
ncbi:MAG: CorA family divalent cation transporter [Methylovirgula sp.]